MDKIAKLALADGTVYTGYSVGAPGTVDGEVVFNTSMTGYQEILTDPSYRGQIVTMTYPHIGNYGVNEEDLESFRPQLAGFVIREISETPSNFRSTGTLVTFLQRHNVVTLAGIDTRALVKRIRDQGAMPGVLSTELLDDDRLIDQAKTSPGLIGRDLVSEVLPDQPVNWNERLSAWWGLTDQRAEPVDSAEGPHLIALDFGMKWNIARHLCELGCRVTILPGTATAEEILSHKPDGIVLSNGPGDPSAVSYAVDTIRQLLGKLPIFGICLGHQLLALACGAQTVKLKFGHRGANQPVLDLQTHKVEITSQNHGFAIDEESLPEELEITHRNLNDQTIAGIRHRVHPAFGVQYHPEASAGPHDSRYLFDQFRKMLPVQTGNGKHETATEKNKQETLTN